MPFRSPQANAHAERFVRTARTECLHWLLILGPRQLDRVLHVYTDHYNKAPAPSARAPTADRDPATTTTAINARRRQRSSAATDSAASYTSTTPEYHPAAA
jgi:putative transposase